MHAVAQDFFGLRDMRIGKLGKCEGGLHSIRYRREFEFNRIFDEFKRRDHPCP
jgi:hypothetical protein